MGLSIVRDSEAERMADVLAFRPGRAPAGNLFAKAARDEYLEEHAERMRRIRRRALAEIEREERGKPEGPGKWSSPAASSGMQTSLRRGDSSKG